MKPKKVLAIVEDSYAEFVLYKKLLEQTEEVFDEIVHLNSKDKAFQYLLAHVPTCCIFDYHLSDGTARELYEALVKELEHLQFPVIISTGQGDERLVVELMQLGVQDYLSKQDLTPADLGRAIRHAVHAREIQAKLRYLAHHDPLTGLLNRALFMDRLDQMMKNADRAHFDFALIYLDLDKFKNINDSYGHGIGDSVLQHVAVKLKECTRASDSVGRLGGDEFVVLLPNTKSYEAHYVVQKLLTKIPEPFETDAGELNVYPSLGLVNYPDVVAKTASELLQQADSALYTAKRGGRNRYVKYSHCTTSYLDQRTKITSHIKIAIQERSLFCVYQPVWDMRSREFAAVEALIRWELAGALVPPQDIIKAILDANLFVDFHQFLFETVFDQHSQWLQECPQLRMNINVPANIIHEPGIIEALILNAEHFDIPKNLIVIEITETNMMYEPTRALAVLSDLRKQGFGIAIDDFGTGYSSLEYLSDLPCQTLKIDQKFLKNVFLNKKNQTIVTATTSLAHQLGLSVVAEGVESLLDMQFSESIQCDYIQGFYVAMPVRGGKVWQAFLDDAEHAALACSNS